jgi:hypothetical protein
MTIEHASGTWYGDVDPGSAATTGNFNISVPSDTDCLIIFVSTFNGTADGCTSGTNGVKLESNTISPDVEVGGCDSDSTMFQGAAWVFYDPPTGTVRVDWTFAASTNEHQFAWMAYKGVGSVRDSSGLNGASVPSRTVTTVSGDKVVVMVEQYYAGVTACTWTNCTGVVDCYDDVSSLLSLAEMTADGASETVSGEYSGGTSDGGCIAISLIPAVLLDQEGFRFRNDDGDEAGATFAEAQDTNITAPLDTNLRVRFIVNAIGDPAATQYQLEAKLSTESDYWKVS